MKIPGAPKLPNPVEGAKDALAAANGEAKKVAGAATDAANDAAKSADRFLQAQTSHFSGLVGQESSVNDTVLSIMRESAASANEDLQYMKDRIDQNNAFRQTLGSLKDAVGAGDTAKIRDLLSANPGEGGMSPFVGMPQLRVKGLEIADLLESKAADTKEQLLSALSDFNKIGSALSDYLGDLNSMMVFQLQTIATESTQADGAVSTAMKKFDAAADRIVDNI